MHKIGGGAVSVGAAENVVACNQFSHQICENTIYQASHKSPIFANIIIITEKYHRNHHHL